MQESKETIGQRLKQIRLSRQISIEKAAEATRIRVQNLQALEADNYSAMSSSAQGRGFLRLYADFLGLDLDAAMTELREAGAESAPTETSLPAEVIPASAPPKTPPLSLDGKPASRPFWARLLRRSAPESSDHVEPAIEVEIEVETKLAEKPATGSIMAPAPEEKPAAKSEYKKKILM